MLDVFNTPVPQNADYQEFYGGGTVRDWVKPRGASMVRMVLIGAGGGGSGGSTSTSGANGGGSGAVTSWIGPAIFIPDVLRVSVGAGGAGSAGSSTTSGILATAGAATSIIYQAKDGTGYTLLTANGGGGGVAGTGGGAGGTVFTNNYFGAAGIFDSIAGQAGSRNANVTASTTTFLSGGAGGNTGGTSAAGYSVALNYGYPTIPAGIAGGGNGNPGFFITQPLMLGAGGSGGGSNGAGTGGVGGNGGIGCGGGGGGRGSTTGGAGGRGGDGAVFIWSW